jgi:5'-nucleotidase (lipoprotein e(P4) family)
MLKKFINKGKTMISKIISILFIMVWIFSCNPSQNPTISDNKSFDRLLVSVSWYQHSAEMTALYYQGFNIARLRFDEIIKADTFKKPPVVVVDIDETMLNNSPFEISLINNEDNLSGWNKWTAKSSAKALPGALEFTKYVQNKKVEIFYITNRHDNERIATLKNLTKEGFPYANEDHLLTKSDLAYSSGNTSSKEGRRAKVAQNHEIILLIGDNLNDFSQIFEDRSVNNGKEAVANNRELFGKKFIILPNPMYGAWEKPLYNYYDNLSEEEKTQLLKSKLLKE